MATLHVLKGANEGAMVPLSADRFVLGRNPDCGVVIPITSVSREHAQILRIGGLYYIEDNKSRNGTYVNNQAISSRVLLKNNDRIRICDFQAAFLDNQQAVDLSGGPDEEDAGSTVEAMLSPSSQQLLETQPAEKLRLILEISGTLSKTLELDALLPKIADSLFNLFRQADRCFLILADEEAGKLIPKLIRTRRAQDEPNARFSRNIVRRCLESGQAFLSDDASRDDRIQLSQSVVDFRIRSVMCVPLLGANGKPFGIIQLDTQDRTKKFTQDDLKLLYGVANQASIALENSRLHEDAVSQERMRRDLELAQRVQKSFLPSDLPKLPQYEFFTYYQSAQQVGGDYYGFIPLSGGRLSVVVGDVAGKGVPAALLMAKLSSDAQLTLLTVDHLGRAVGQLNQMLYPHLSPLDRFVTLIAVVLDPASHAVTMSNAGHLAPLIVKPTGGADDAHSKDVAGVPLGVLDEYDFDLCSLALKSGESLVLFTDGVPDALSARDQQFGMAGLLAAVKATPGGSPRAIGERIVRAVQQHTAGREYPHDDITLVVLGRTS